MLPVFFVERISGLRKGELAALLWSNLEVERKALLISKWVVQGGRDQGDSAQDSDLCPKNLHPPRSGEFAGAGAGGGEDGQFYDACHVRIGKSTGEKANPFSLVLSASFSLWAKALMYPAKGAQKHPGKRVCLRGVLELET